MYRLLVLSMAVGLCATAAIKNDSHVLIVGGTDAEPGANPHQCSLRRSSHSCGASIISDEWVVTAAHCIDGSSPSSLSLRCGTELHASGGVDFTVAELIPHESYDSWALDYDVGLIRINGRFSLGSGNVNKIELTGDNDQLPAKDKVTVTGWGAIREGGALPARLQTVDVPVVANDVCKQKYDGFNDITDRMFCAGVDEGGLDSCQGDSGGPVKHQGKLVGAVSWGYGCARPNYPGVYTRLSTLRAWIKGKTSI
ncbi:trypsin Blo t 3-like [Oppia nitens]|uniref:trypsin Blo t 3-like n=1 Tax=Oppia nitens TaxID=1686743 RepID=UPI0023DA9F0A|nr:trypsin Blo t 3-like [Oppia nitens]